MRGFPSRKSSRGTSPSILYQGLSAAIGVLGILYNYHVKPLQRSKLRNIMPDDFQQAASRHLSDAQCLLDKQRWDNAVYLAGYVVECSFKVLVEVYIDSASAKKYGHDLAELQGQAMERLRFMYPALDMQLPANRTMGTVLEQFHPERRYAKSGLWSEVETKQAVQRAEEIYLEIIPGLILDGRISI